MDSLLDFKLHFMNSDSEMNKFHCQLKYCNPEKNIQSKEVQIKCLCSLFVKYEVNKFEEQIMNIFFILTRKLCMFSSEKNSFRYKNKNTILFCTFIRSAFKYK